MVIFLLLTAFMVIGLLLSEYFESIWGKWLTKPLASAGFVGIALIAGAWQSEYGRWVLLALILSWLGDVLLIPQKSPKIFQAGIFSFLLGHLAYAMAFWVRGIDMAWGIVAIVILTLPAGLILRWLKPNLPKDMQIPVYAYIAVISLMVALSAATTAFRLSLSIFIGAFMFYCSDLSVARDRFIAEGFVNRLWGLPLYYCAQIILAGTAAQIS